MGDAGGAVEEVADAVAAVGADDGEAVDAGAARDAVPEVAEAGAGLDERDGLLQAVVRAFDQGFVLGRDFSYRKGLVEVSVVAAEEGGDVYVDDVPFGELPVFFFVFSLLFFWEVEVEERKQVSFFPSLFSSFFPPLSSFLSLSLSLLTSRPGCRGTPPRSPRCTQT